MDEKVVEVDDFKKKQKKKLDTLNEEQETEEIPLNEGE